MPGMFPDSAALREIVESKGWSLYRLPEVLKEGARIWDFLELQGPAKEFGYEEMYIFAPKRKPGETLREAYSVTQGLGPSLRVDNPDDEKWEFLYIPGKYILPGNSVCISRLYFSDEHDVVLATMGKSRYSSDPPEIGIKLERAVEVFNDCFEIILPEEVGLEAPMKPWPNPDDN